MCRFGKIGDYFQAAGTSETWRERKLLMATLFKKNWSRYEQIINADVGEDVNSGQSITQLTAFNSHR